MLPLWADIDEGTVRGFIALRETSPYAAEIYVMGVKKEYQRHKIGKGMFTALLNYARRPGVRVPAGQDRQGRHQRAI